jgi:ATP:corrinoid adenosyltransferase
MGTPLEDALLKEATKSAYDQWQSTMPSADPNNYQGWNSSAARKGAAGMIQRNASRGRNNLAAQFAKMGVDGADRNNAFAQAQADENTQLAGMNAEMDWRDYQSRVDAMNRAMGLWNQNNQNWLNFNQATGKYQNQPDPLMNLIGQVGGVAASKYLV